MSKFNEGFPGDILTNKHESKEKKLRIPEVYTKYQELIKPENAVLVVGPSASVFHDASLLFVAKLLGKDGKLFVADPQSKSIVSDKELEEKVGGRVTGIGNINRYFDDMRILKNTGMALANPEWLGGESGAQRITLPNNSLDIIVDHNTSVFLAGLPGILERKERERTLQTIYREYQRVLKHGGKILLQTNNDRYELKEKSFIRFIESNGFKVEHCAVEDVLEVPISPSVYKNLSDSNAANNEDASWFYFVRMKSLNGVHTIRFDSPDQFSPDLYICNKI